MFVIKDFFTQDEVNTMRTYAESIEFHTKENHPPLHDGLFNGGVEFDIKTRGELPDHILQIFSSYSKRIYDHISEIEDFDYHPPMFSKYYIARYRPGMGAKSHTDESKPDGTYVSYVFWNDNFSGGKLTVFSQSDPSNVIEIDYKPGDLIVFPENSFDDMRAITPVEDGVAYFSQAWLGRKGQAWFDNVDYDNTDWEDWEIKGF